MLKEDVTAYQNKEASVEEMMEKYYPTKVAKQVTLEQFKADRQLSDGRTIDKMNVYKEKDETKQDFGKYKLYAQVGEQKISQLMSWKDLNAYFDRVTTPAKLVEKNFGERLHLASAYEKYKLPEGIKMSDVRVSKDKQNGKWNIFVNMKQLVTSGSYTTSDYDANGKPINQKNKVNLLNSAERYYVANEVVTKLESINTDLWLLAWTDTPKIIKMPMICFSFLKNIMSPNYLIAM